jgi:hypothetical protein
MDTEFSLGSALYFVPRWDTNLASYVRVTRIHSAFKQPLLTLGNQLVITPQLHASGMVARDKAGSFWISKEAFEASRSWLGRAWRLKPFAASTAKIASGMIGRLSV